MKTWFGSFFARVAVTCSHKRKADIAKRPSIGTMICRSRQTECDLERRTATFRRRMCSWLDWPSANSRFTMPANSTAERCAFQDAKVGHEGNTMSIRDVALRGGDNFGSGL